MARFLNCGAAHGGLAQLRASWVAIAAQEAQALLAEGVAAAARRLVERGRLAGVELGRARRRRQRRPAERDAVQAGGSRRLVGQDVAAGVPVLRLDLRARVPGRGRADRAAAGDGVVEQRARPVGAVELGLVTAPSRWSTSRCSARPTRPRWSWPGCRRRSPGTRAAANRCCCRRRPSDSRRRAPPSGSARRPSSRWRACRPCRRRRSGRRSCGPRRWSCAARVSWSKTSRWARP